MASHLTHLYCSTVLDKEEEEEQEDEEEKMSNVRISASVDNSESG